jgi:hypothetical protein
MTLHAGDVAPHVVAMDIVPGSSGLDLSTVTVVVIKAQRPDGTILSWSTALTDQTTTTLTATHTLAAGTSEISEAGTWRFYALMTVPGGYLRTETVSELVHGAFE